MKPESSATIIRKLQKGIAFVGIAEQFAGNQLMILVTTRPFGHQIIIEVTVGIQPIIGHRKDFRQSLLSDATLCTQQRFKGDMEVNILDLLYQQMRTGIAEGMAHDKICLRLFEEAWRNLQEIPQTAHHMNNFMITERTDDQ